MKKLTLTMLCVLCASVLSLRAGPGHNHGNENSAAPAHGKKAAHAHASGAHSAHSEGRGHSHADGSAHSHGDGHGHSHDGGKKAAGPNGGRVIHSVEPHAEFFVNKDRKVQITFLDDEGKAVAPAGQTVTLTTGSRANPLRLAFVEKDGVLLSDAALPEGNNFPIVLQFRSVGAKPVTERFTANLSQCPTCAYAEYACICEGHG